MDYTEKIKKIEENILKSQEVINREQNKIKKWKSEIETCKSLEIQGLIDSLDIPYDEVKNYLKGLKNK